jgi:acyl-ACP thioesterase
VAVDSHDRHELIAAPEHGRVFELTVRAGLADCAPSGRLRLDALARWMQDVAYADVEDAGLAQAAVWVLRRTRIRVARFPRFGERLSVRTFCSGVGRMWAERRTTVALQRAPAGDLEAAAQQGAPASDVEAVALWVHLDPITWRPTKLREAEFAIYGATGSDRRVTARLRHPPPEAHAPSAAWTFRATECDLADHVNNAAYWQPLEEELLAGSEPDRIDVEIEFRTPSQPGEKRILSSESRRWITAADGEVHASVLIHALNLQQG